MSATDDQFEKTVTAHGSCAPSAGSDRETLRAWTREAYDAEKALLEANGYTVVSRWRKGLKHIRLADIVLSGPNEKLTDPTKLNRGNENKP